MRTDIPLVAQPGLPTPLGATVREGGTNFAVFSQGGTRAFVCLFDPGNPAHEIARHELAGREDHVFFGFVPGVRAGALYGFRVDGPYRPHDGLRFNVHKLLVDPYARALTGTLDWTGPIFAYPPGDPGEDLAFDPRDDAAAKPKSVVVAPSDFDWGADRPPAIPWRDTVIYELHAKGFTRLHPDVPAPLRGTYAGLGHPAVVAHLQRLGVTAVELLPIQSFVDEQHLARRGLPNYWGYNTLGFFAPEARYAAARTPAGVVREVKEMVKALHAGGIEVILDVVYNHTAEGDQCGPSLSFRGLDPSYYLTVPDDPRRLASFTGCGNSFAASSSPWASKLLLDSLRYWVTEIRVDGFRFDLATTLGRCGRHQRFSRDASFFHALHGDPALGRCKLIAEPWDVFADDSYQFGNFPVRFAEWNGEVRDGVRRFLRGDGGQAGAIRAALTGTPDRFEASGRGPLASVNFVTCHDGFTLRDLVSYERKHNEANGEENRDGWNDNSSFNHGVEGDSDDPDVLVARERHARAALALVALSRGVPMLLGGDELWRTQGGNNNAYCQDNEVSWVDWSRGPFSDRLTGFVRRLLACRRGLTNLAVPQAALVLQWFLPDGRPMTGADWNDAETRAFALLTSAGDDTEDGPAAASSLLLVNGAAADVSFTLPSSSTAWRVALDSARDEAAAAAPAVYPLLARSVVLLQP